MCVRPWSNRSGIVSGWMMGCRCYSTGGTESRGSSLCGWRIGCGCTKSKKNGSRRMGAALGCADILYQGVGSVSNRCPYFREECRNKIVCEGITADCNMHQTFANSKDKQSYVREYCDGFYASCSLAQILNECHGRYTTMVCPYNAGVDCLDNAQCHRCGWNPVVAAERLRKWMESHSCNR